MSTPPPSKPNGGNPFDLLMTREELERDCPKLAEWLSWGKFGCAVAGGHLPVIRVGGGFRVRLYTARHTYSIIALPNQDNDKSYLGCTAAARMPRAGENHTRGNDLADGKFTTETWCKILADIVSYELMPLESQDSFRESIKREAERREGIATVAAEKVLP